MKKLLFIIPLLFINIAIVKAEDNVAHLNNFYDNYSSLSNIYNNYQTEINNLITYYNNNYSQYINYVIYYYNSPYTNNYDYIVLFPTTSNYFDIISFYSNIAFDTTDVGGLETSYYYNITTNQYSVSNSNFPLHRDMPLLTKNDFILNSTQYDKVIIPSFSDTNLDVSYPSIDLFNGSVLPTFSTLSNGSYGSLLEVNLSNYDYIILSLKNYTTQPFITTIYTQGSLCFTPVYNYGMTQKQDIISDSQTQGCTESYLSLTPVSIHIIQSDLDNHSFYYIKQQPNNPTILKIPTSIFDITYITSNDTNPQVSVNGRSYPVIPFSELTDTANISTDTGYVSGQVCSLGDVNCEYRTIGLDITELWTQPIKVLQSVWASITSVFVVITEFIMLIPSPLREFLVSAFFLSVILGVLKILI